MPGIASALGKGEARRTNGTMELKKQLLTTTAAPAVVKKRTAQPLVGSERKAWTVQRWAAEMDVSVPTTWDWIKQGRLRTVKVGGRRLIRDSPDDYMDACAAEAAAKAAAAE
jgi:excisionase family DNA binding protein